MPSHLPPSRGQRTALTSNLIVAPLRSTVKVNAPAPANTARPTLVLAASGVGSTPQTANTKGRFTTAATTELNTPDIKLEDILGERDFRFSDTSKHSASLAIPTQSMEMTKARDGGEEPLPSLDCQSNPTIYCDMSPFTNDQVHMENEMDITNQRRIENDMDINTILENNDVFKILESSTNSPLNQEESNIVFNKDLSFGNGPMDPHVLSGSEPLNQTSGLNKLCITGAGSIKQQPMEVMYHESPPSFGSLLEEPSDMNYTLDMIEDIFRDTENDPVDIKSIDMLRGNEELMLTNMQSGNEEPVLSMECGNRTEVQQRAINILANYGLKVHLPADQPEVSDRWKGSATDWQGQPSTSNSIQPSTSTLVQASTLSYQEVVHVGGPMTLNTQGQCGIFKPRPASYGPDCTSTFNSGLTTHSLYGESASLEVSQRAKTVPSHKPSVLHNAPKADQVGPTRVRRVTKPKLQSDFVMDECFERVIEGAERDDACNHDGDVSCTSSIGSDVEFLPGIPSTSSGGLRGRKRNGIRPTSNTSIPSSRSSGQRGRGTSRTRNMTGEEKYRRSRVLNNEASKRCRQRKKDKMAKLEEELKIQKQRNEKLQSQAEILTKRIAKMKALYALLLKAINERLNSR